MISLQDMADSLPVPAIESSRLLSRSICRRCLFAAGSTMRLKSRANEALKAKCTSKKFHGTADGGDVSRVRPHKRP